VRSQWCEVEHPGLPRTTDNDADRGLKENCSQYNDVLVDPRLTRPHTQIKVRQSKCTHCSHPFLRHLARVLFESHAGQHRAFDVNAQLVTWLELAHQAGHCLAHYTPVVSHDDTNIGTLTLVGRG
jgi:hypothetical protein